MKTPVNQKQALMIAVAILGKEKIVSDYGYAALHEAKKVLQEMLDEKDAQRKKSEFNPMKIPVKKEKFFEEITIAEFERQELAKLRGKSV